VAGARGRSRGTGSNRRPSRQGRYRGRGGVSAEVTSVAVKTAVPTVAAADLAVHVLLARRCAVSEGS
jgi:hypothetical protein